jgi:hypothetical protein
VVFEDIDGAKSSTGKLVDKIQVMGFANQRNGSKLGGWLRKAGLRVAQDYPDLEVVHLGFADVSRLPRLLRRMVVPLLRTIHDISKTELEAAYGHDEVLYLAPTVLRRVWTPTIRAIYLLGRQKWQNRGEF